MRTHYELSKSPYLNQIINNLFSELQSRPSPGGDLSTLQTEIVDEISQSKLVINGEEVEMEDVIENHDMEDKEAIFPELMSFVLMKVIFKMKDKAMNQFIHAQEKNVIDYKLVVKPQDVLRNFIQNGFYEFSQREQSKEVTEYFIKLISSKFKEKVMMLDDIDMTPEVSQGKMILLEDSKHIITQSNRENLSPFSEIILELILKDRQVSNAFANILKTSFTKSDSQTVAFTRALVKDYITLTVRKLTEHEPFYTEQSLSKFLKNLGANTATLYVTIDNEDIEVSPQELFGLLNIRKFSPDEDNNEIRQKLGIQL